MNYQKLPLLVPLTLLLTACVTINIYFPAAAAERAAEQIVEDILRSSEQPPTRPPEEAPPNAAIEAPHLDSSRFNPLHWLIPAAHASEPDFTVNTPQIRQLQAAMRQRHSQLESYYQSGAIGFTADGMVAIRDSSAITLRDRPLVQRLISEENRDRDALYQAIAAANGRPDWEAEIRTIFANKWIEKSGSGWWYQASDGQWRQR